MTTETLDLGQSLDFQPKFEKDGEMIVVGKTMLNPVLPELTNEFLTWKKEFWVKMLKEKGIKNIVAPMVDQSELAFRVLLRRHGAHLCYTPMIHAHLFVTNFTYRRQALSTIPSDRPLIVQFCANDPDIFLDACRLVEGYCDGVDLNLGCPQIVAKRGQYGSFLQEKPDLIRKMIEKVHKHCRLPLSVKIRCLETVERTLEYAKLCEDAGACMLTIHGRRRDQRGVETGVADWEKIRAVVEHLSIPVIANGNIQMPGDVEKCIEKTGAVAVMSAEGILSNPLLFEGIIRPGFDVAKEYLELAERYKASTATIRAHVFRMCHYSFLKYPDLRERNSYVISLDEFKSVVNDLEKRCREENTIDPYDVKLVDLALPFPEMVASIPYYLCKPYVRATQSLEPVEKDFRIQRKVEMAKIQNETGLSFRQIRKRERRRIDMKKEFSRKCAFPVCKRCNQPAGVGCENEMCRKCCRFVCVRNGKLCKAHRFTIETLRDRRDAYAEQMGINKEDLKASDALGEEQHADTAIEVGES
ncbi:unnamed protein product [Bursaphelenchus okinawaensis]|uniref:tRNA-dihydrouridine(16/17) synthase [NAD(P)(+)] n=1 Tax=Bursaphelenchus okinawaensis TaxID=465554 RepID=A0A811JR68_9BILA|nr:unnamed protein product [Bursaphelenchus okinawaensis]CAG9079746.1 unnamed protein product [Bursaphelenchus okinawaensis]